MTAGHVIEDGSMDQGTAKEEGEKLVWGYALQIESTRYTDGLDKEKEREREHILDVQQVVVPCTKSKMIGRYPEREKPRKNQERIKFEGCIRQPGKDTKQYLAAYMNLGKNPMLEGRFLDSLLYQWYLKPKPSE